MKKLTIALLALLGYSTSTLAASVYDKNDTQLDIFGSISAFGMSDGAARVIKSRSTKKNHDNTLQTTANLGLSGRTKINDSLYGIAHTQWRMPSGSNGTEEIKTDYQYVGFDALNYGTLTFGRGDNAFYTVAGATDIYNQLDSRVNDHYFLGDQMPSMFMYSLSALGWDFRVSYQTSSDDINNTDVNLYSAAAFSVATHLSNGISVAYGMSYYDFKYNNSVQMVNHFMPAVNKMHGFDENNFLTASIFKPSWKVDKGISISYGDYGDGLYAALVLTSSKYQNFTNHLYSYEAIVNYTFENGMELTAGYGIKRFDGVNIMSNATIGVGYNVAPTFKVFGEASFDINSKPEKYYSKSQIDDYALDKNKVLVGATYSY